MNVHRKIGLLIVSIYIFCALALLSWAYIFSDIPKITKESLYEKIPQTTKILDREGNLLYTFFEEDREYVPFDALPQHLIDAFISAEDRDYRIHSGIDTIGIGRAIINNIATIRDDSKQIQGASTIPQQLIKNFYLSNERTFRRKIQELFLVRKLYTVVRNSLEDTYDQVDEQQIKEHIFELYVNYIFLGNNSYGVQSASKKYFNHEISEISVLESSILAGLPKAPTKYNPLKNPDKTLGYREISDGKTTEKLSNRNDRHSVLVQQIMKKIEKSILEDSIDYTSPAWLSQLWYGEFFNNDQKYAYQYTPGRKDYVLRGMYQQNLLSKEAMIDAFMESAEITFDTYTYQIDSPHFVFWIKEYLKNHPYFSSLDLQFDTLPRKGYTITTSLDPQIQQKAVQTVANSKAETEENGGNNRALLHIDSTNGDILGYVGSQDYFDNDIQGQVDMIQAKRQQGSVLKPLVFAKFLMTYPFGIDGKVVDYYMNLGLSYNPNNSDLGSMGKVSLSRALVNSRNLATIRLFFALNGETVIKNFFRSLGLTSLDTERTYGYTVTLGAAEESLLNLGAAYLQLSSPNSTNIPEPSPILKITDSDGSVLYDKKGSPLITERKIPSGVSYLLRVMLNKRNEMTPKMRSLMSIGSLSKYATKSGTSDVKKEGKILPKDALFVTYTPNDTVIVRGGNTDSQPLNDGMLGGKFHSRFLNTYFNQIIELRKENNNSYTESYKKPNDLTDGFIYKNTEYSSIPKKIQKILWKF